MFVSGEGAEEEPADEAEGRLKLLILCWACEAVAEEEGDDEVVACC